MLLLLIGPRFIDVYVDWLWFGELGYRSVFTTQLVTRLVVFLVAAVLIGAVVYAAMALAYRTRPVFVPTAGPNDPIARYRTAVMSRLRLVGIGVPAFIGVFAGIVAQSYWPTVQLFLQGGAFGIADPQFGKDLGFYAFDLPFYRLVLTYLFVATFLAFITNLVGHYLFGGIRLSGRSGALSRAARIQLITLVGVLMLLKAAAYWLDRYELLSHSRTGKPFTGAGYTDINAVLPAKLILMAIAVICAAAVFSAIVLRDLRIPAIGVVLLLLSSMVIGAGWPLVVEQFSVKPNAAQKESEYISRSIGATRQAYGLTEESVTYRNYSGDAQATAQQVASDRATTSNIRLLDPTIVSPAFTQFQQGKNFYYFPDQLAMDRYVGRDGNLRDFVVAARELNPDRLIDNQRDWINRHTVYTHGNGFIASPANTVRGVANDPNQNGGYPEFLASVVGANGGVVSPGPAPLEQPRVYFGPVIAAAAADYAIVGKNADADREYDYETNTETKNYTYTGRGGVPIGNWLTRSVFAAKFAERNFLFSNVIGENSKILFNRDPAERVEAVAPWLTTDTSVYPAIVNKKMVWIVDGYTTLDNYPYSQLTSLSTATADSTEVNQRLVPKKLLADRHLTFDRGPVYRNAPGCVGCVMPSEAVAKTCSALLPAHEGAIRIAARSPRHVSTEKDHSPGLVVFIAEQLGIVLPQPSHIEIEFADIPCLPEEIADADEFEEGAVVHVLVSRYERDPTARRRCIQHYGTSCFICGFSLASEYGPEFNGLIYVHHLTPISSVGRNATVDPVRDLRPVCPNCHAAVHWMRPSRSPRTIEQLQKALHKRRITNKRTIRRKSR